ncbi:MAG: DUF2256 domain-containing protein [Chloracidobacterium sp.]|nr:DUF2256 domain-containing protein [Chloracidobacterium sp.]
MTDLRSTKKQHLPTKICSQCGRPFTWRRRWAKVWDKVKYCSRRCSNTKPRNQSPAYQS